MTHTISHRSQTFYIIDGTMDRWERESQTPYTGTYEFSLVLETAGAVPDFPTSDLEEMCLKALQECNPRLSETSLNTDDIQLKSADTTRTMQDGTPPISHLEMDGVLRLPGDGRRGDVHFNCRSEMTTTESPAPTTEYENCNRCGDEVETDGGVKGDDGELYCSMECLREVYC